MNITNIDLSLTQIREVEEMLKESKDSLGRRCDLMLVLSDGLKVLLVKRDDKLVVQSLESLEI